MESRRSPGGALPHAPFSRRLEASLPPPPAHTFALRRLGRSASPWRARWMGAQTRVRWPACRGFGTKLGAGRSGAGPWRGRRAPQKEADPSPLVAGSPPLPDEGGGLPAACPFWSCQSPRCDLPHPGVGAVSWTSSSLDGGMTVEPKSLVGTWAIAWLSFPSCWWV